MSDKRVLPAELWHAAEGAGGLWWIEDQHGATVGGPFRTPIEANEQISASRDLQLRLRDVMDQHRERRMRQPLGSEHA